jgi:hypothetical protein
MSRAPTMWISYSTTDTVAEAMLTDAWGAARGGSSAQALGLVDREAPAGRRVELDHVSLLAPHAEAVAGAVLEDLLQGAGLEGLNLA